ncbi:hypothetical protein U1Q18_047576, partial [Sarracenia purpurea var. burkii]
SVGAGEERGGDGDERGGDGREAGSVAATREKGRRRLAAGEEGFVPAAGEDAEAEERERRGGERGKGETAGRENPRKG